MILSLCEGTTGEGLRVSRQATHPHPNPLQMERESAELISDFLTLISCSWRINVMTRQRPFSLIAVIVFLLTAFCLLPTAFSQTATATLSGTVVDQNGAVVPNADITVENIGTALKRETTTNDEGYFTVPLLPPATYSVTAQRTGFMVTRLETVVLNVGDQKALIIQLKTGDVKETVVVTGEAPLINESPAVATIVDRQFVGNLPLNGRSLQSLITLTPGIVPVPSVTNVTGGFSVNGQRSSANAFTVDGVSANFSADALSIPGPHTSGNLPGLTASGTTQSLVSVDALQEFKVETSTYSAEYGRQPGGQISILTRSGTNDFHGSLFDYVRNDVFDANDWFASANRQPKAQERQNDFGGTFSGPVILPGYNGRNRTNFFFSYEGLRLRLPKFALTDVPTLCLRGSGGCSAGQNSAPPGLQPILKAFALPNGRDLGNGFAEFTSSYSNPSSLNATSIRIDHALNKKLTLFGRYNQAPSESDVRNAPYNLSNITSQRLTAKTLTAGVTALLSAGTSNEFRANYSENFSTISVTQNNFGGAIPLPRTVLIPSQYDSPTAQGGALFSLPGFTTDFAVVSFVDRNNSRQRLFNLVDNFSHQIGTHSLKFGVDWRRLTPTWSVNSYQLAAYFFSQQSVLNASPEFVSLSALIPTEPIYTNFSAYARDTWRMSRRLTVDVGLRWEVNSPPGEANGHKPPAVDQINNLATMRLASPGTRLWKTTHNNFAPRVGVAYELNQTSGRETVLRGGFGVYYDTGNDYASRTLSSFPFRGDAFLSNLVFPLSPSDVAPPPIPILAPSLVPRYGTLHVFDPHLKLPYTLQWSAAVEQSIGKSQAFTVSYVASVGRRLLQARLLNLTSVNPDFRFVFLTNNRATSNYHSLQAQFQRRLSRGWQALLSYTWSHAIDEDSNSLGLYVPQRGNASFDIRHNFAAAVTYDIPSHARSRPIAAILNGWSIDSSIHAYTAPPVDLSASSEFDPATGALINVRPDLITGVPLYINDSTVPGGRRINAAAFSFPLAGTNGNLGRNVVRGLPAWQVDVALRRQFKLSERLQLQFRAEAFNLFNHPNFGSVQTNISAGNFGQAQSMLNRSLGGLNQLYQLGGPRSFQFALKFLF